MGICRVKRGNLSFEMFWETGGMGDPLGENNSVVLLLAEAPRK